MSLLLAALQANLIKPLLYCSKPLTLRSSIPTSGRVMRMASKGGDQEGERGGVPTPLRKYSLICIREEGGLDENVKT
jgi:hypothetical protein